MGLKGNLPESYLRSRLSLIVPHIDIDSSFNKDSGQLPFSHGSSDMKGCVSVLVLLGDFALGADEDPGDPGVSVPGGSV